jgi:hypothetical protein
MTSEMPVPPNSGDETRAHLRRANEDSMVSGRRVPSNGNGKAPKYRIKSRLRKDQTRSQANILRRGVWCDFERRHANEFRGLQRNSLFSRRGNFCEEPGNLYA